MPGLPVLPSLWEFDQVHVHSVSDAIQPSHPLPYDPAILLLGICKTSRNTTSKRYMHLSVHSIIIYNSQVEAK